MGSHTPSLVNEQRIMEAVWVEHQKPAWQWPDAARERLALYLATGKYSEKDKEHCVRSIVTVLNRAYRSAETN